MNILSLSHCHLCVAVESLIFVLGERGEPVIISDAEGIRESKKAEQEFGFNTYVSDMISLNRTIPDIRMEECKHWNYPETLPTVSVVIVFHNEGWTPLLRTVHSVLLRSPPKLIKEIVMVDDYSDKGLAISLPQHCSL
ncbi:hypothetical protein OESDEN_18048 [Oesophagostomum dentatum]|uniref:Glycosyltransferase 2-like domain-containing protein n=1 Tax=Oesophagostomum dentatum TaxID=61180 RepID=A0A0B1SGE5_OESDE|nr:hypothetical protein OESDEN_18048 [Oesophagostomum dentatum]